MAAHIESKNIKALPVLPYSDLRGFTQEDLDAIAG